jgi:hypothetical protein
VVTSANHRSSYYTDYPITYEDFPAPGRQSSFTQRLNDLNSSKNERALVIRERETERYEPPSVRTRSVERVRPPIGERGRSPVVMRRSSPIVVTQRESSIERPRYRERLRSATINSRMHEERENSLLRKGDSMKEAQVVLRPDSDQDITISLELDVEGDVESQLEEFSRLQRLGDFHAAEQYFQTNLDEYLNIPLVAVEYAEMLLQQGAYQRLKDLLQRSELKARVPSDSNASFPSTDRLSVGNPATRGKDRKIEGGYIPTQSQSMDTVNVTRPQYSRMDLSGNSLTENNPGMVKIAFSLIGGIADMYSQGSLRRVYSLTRSAEIEFLMLQNRTYLGEDPSSTEVGPPKSLEMQQRLTNYGRYN